jgi:hypothetical protein
MRSLLLNVEGRERAWAFMKAHWDEMLRHYPDSSIVRMCEGVTGLVTPALEADVREFFASHPVKQGKKTLEQYLERLRIAVLCKQREGDSFWDWLEHRPWKGTRTKEEIDTYLRAERDAWDDER